MKRGNWIQDAVRNPGALRSWLRRNRGKIKRLTGRDPFRRDGEISIRALKALRRTEWYTGLNTTTKRRINLAITLKKLRRKQ